MLGTQHGHLYVIRHVVPDQARFEPEHFMVLTEDGPTLFNLISQSFQDNGFTECNNVFGKQCLNDTNLVKASFKE